MQIWVMYDRRGVELYHVPLTITVQRDEDVDQWVGTCRELDVSSQGDTIGEALDETVTATLLYLNMVEELGERKRVFGERGIEAHFGEPDWDSEPHHAPAEGVSTTHVYVGHKEHVPA